MTRLLLLAVAIWALIGMPGLCLAGALLHPCDCGDSCGHEEVCDSDPCSNVASTAPIAGKVAPLASPALETSSVLLDGRWLEPPACAGAGFPAPVERANLPLFPTSLPRLL